MNKMEKYQIFSLTLCRKVSEILVHLSTESTGANNNQHNESHLIYPNESGTDNTRFSEQESKMLFCQKIENIGVDNFYYSVETPTDRKYRFTGEGHGAGNFDISIHSWERTYFKRVINIELKNKNCDIMNIWKDLLKLSSDNPGTPGIFFHTMPSVNSASLHANPNTSRKGILDKYEESFNCLRDGVRPDGTEDLEPILDCNVEEIRNNINSIPFLLYAVCILFPEPGLLYKIQDEESLTRDNGDFFDYDYEHNNMTSNHYWTWDPM